MKKVARKALIAGMTVALVAGGTAGVTGVAQAETVSNPGSTDSEGRIPTEGPFAGWSLSGSLNDWASGSSDWTDIQARWTAMWKGIFLGPFVGSTGMGSSEGSLDWNKRDY